MPGQPVRPVLVVLAALVQDDLALVVELGFGQRRQQVAHPVRFHPQRQLEGVARHDFPVVRPIGVGRSVQRRARLLQRLKVSVVVVLRALEHQVFEEVGETGPARLLVLRPDVVPDVDRDDRAVAVLVDEDVESVVERPAAERDLHRSRRRRLVGNQRALAAWIGAAAQPSGDRIDPRGDDPGRDAVRRAEPQHVAARPQLFDDRPAQASVRLRGRRAARDDRRTSSADAAS